MIAFIVEFKDNQKISRFFTRCMQNEFGVNKILETNYCICKSIHRQSLLFKEMIIKLGHSEEIAFFFYLRKLDIL